MLHVRTGIGFLTAACLLAACGGDVAEIGSAIAVAVDRPGLYGEVSVQVAGDRREWAVGDDSGSCSVGAIADGLEPGPTTIHASGESGFYWKMDVDLLPDECVEARLNSDSLISQLLLVVDHRPWKLPAEIFVDGVHVATINEPLRDNPADFIAEFERQAMLGPVEGREKAIELYLAGAGALIARPEGIYELEVRHADGAIDAKTARFWRGGVAYWQFF